jgi:signal transduction histidine kinase
MSSNATEKNSRPGEKPPVALSGSQHNLHRLDRLANLGLISAGLAHEIKNSLVAVNTFVEVMLEKGDEQEMSGLVRRELKRIDGLATQMLRFAAAPRSPTSTTVSVKEVVEHCLRLLSHQMSERMIVLKRDYRAEVDGVFGDESQLHQAFMNLLLNGVEAMHHHGELTISTWIDNGRLLISIRDTGSGITPEHLAHIFEPFFTTKKNGTGLGLAICWRVMEEHRGSIELQSQVGQGTTFKVSLPLA